MLKIGPTACLLTVTLLAFAGISNSADENGVIMHDGKVMILSQGQTQGTLSHEMTLDNGIKVMPDGTVMMKAGKEMKMQNGTVITTDGHIMRGSHAMPMRKENQ
jgi:hypothetical protein